MRSSDPTPTRRCTCCRSPPSRCARTSSAASPTATPARSTGRVELIRQVHDLTELVQRPFNLRLVADQLGALERRIASGERVNTAALYEELVATGWTATRASTSSSREHKIRLMGELAATLWRDGRRSLPVDRLEAWLEQRLDCRRRARALVSPQPRRARGARRGSAHRDVRRAPRSRRVRVRPHVAAGVLPRPAPGRRARRRRQRRLGAADDQPGDVRLPRRDHRRRRTSRRASGGCEACARRTARRRRSSRSRTASARSSAAHPASRWRASRWTARSCAGSRSPARPTGRCCP